MWDENKWFVSILSIILGFKWIFWFVVINEWWGINFCFVIFFVCYKFLIFIVEGDIVICYLLVRVMMFLSVNFSNVCVSFKVNLKLLFVVFMVWVLGFFVFFSMMLM